MRSLLVLAALSLLLPALPAMAGPGDAQGQVRKELRAGNVRSLRETLTRIIRTSTEEADRRAGPRSACALAARITGAGQSFDGTICDLSAGGAAVEADTALPAGCTVTIQVPATGWKLAGTVVDAFRSHALGGVVGTALLARAVAHVGKRKGDEVGHYEPPWALRSTHSKCEQRTPCDDPQPFPG